MLVVDDATYFFDAHTDTGDAIEDLCATYLRSARPQLVLASTCNLGGSQKWLKHRLRMWRRAGCEGVLQRVKPKRSGATAVSHVREGATAALPVSDTSTGQASIGVVFTQPAEDRQPKTTAWDQRPLLAVTIPANELSLEGIKHFYIDVEREEWKLETFCDIYPILTATQVRCACTRALLWRDLIA
jgi:hypothetical protein